MILTSVQSNLMELSPSFKQATADGNRELGNSFNISFLQGCMESFSMMPFQNGCSSYVKKKGVRSEYSMLAV